MDIISKAAGKLWHMFARTKKVFVPVTISLVSIVGVTLGATGMISPSYALASKCTLSITSGNVDVILQGAEEEQAGTDGMSLDAGDRVITATDSQAELMFFDGSILTLESGTEVEITKLKGEEHFRTILLKQWIGTTYSRVEKMVDSGSQYEIETPTALAAVRGTQFFTEVDETGATTVATTEGLVSVSGQGAEVFVPVGKQTLVETGTIPSEPEEFDTSKYAKPGDSAKKDNFQNRMAAAQAVDFNPPAFSNAENANRWAGFEPVNGNQVVGTALNNNNASENTDNKNQSDDAHETRQTTVNKVENQGSNNGPGNGNANGQDNNSLNGHGVGNTIAQDNGNANGRGNDNNIGQGNGNANGRDNENGNDNPEDEGVNNSPDQGNGNGNANGRDNENGNGSPDDEGVNNSPDQGNGNGNANGRDNENGNDNPEDEGVNNSPDQGNGNGNSNGQDNGNGNNKDKRKEW